MVKSAMLPGLDVQPSIDPANLIGGERVDFSCRVEVLVTKFGRSSKPSPRMLIIVLNLFLTI